MNIILYYTASCHLCEEAEATYDKAIHAFLMFHPHLKETIHYQKIDILNDNAAYERYELKIPVLHVLTSSANKIMCWPFNTDELLHCFMNTTRKEH